MNHSLMDSVLAYELEQFRLVVRGQAFYYLVPLDPAKGMSSPTSCVQRPGSGSAQFVSAAAYGAV
jgi:hypothetical protein